jgi:hypothetical protein
MWQANSRGCRRGARNGCAGTPQTYGERRWQTLLGVELIGTPVRVGRRVPITALTRADNGGKRLLSVVLGCRLTA